MVRPLLIVWPWWPLYWAVCFWALLPELRLVRRAQRAVKEPGSRDAGSIKVITRGGGLASLIAIPIAWIPALRFPVALAVPVYLTGVLMTWSAALLRRHCFRQLGESFTGDVRAEAGQVIVTTGAYQYVRHPSYLAGIILNTGMGMALGSWASALVLLVAGFAIYSYRIAVEEQALLEVVGEPYREFMRTRRRLIPFVY